MKQILSKAFQFGKTFYATISIQVSFSSLVLWKSTSLVATKGIQPLKRLASQ